MFVVNNIVTHRPPIRPPNGTRTEEKPHPSRGGNAYPPEMRDQVLSLWENGVDLQRSPWIAELRDERQFPCWKTCKRWIELYNSEGHSLRKRATGNRISEREVNGQDLVNLAVYRMVRPKAYIDEVRAYVHNMHPENPPYSRSQIGRAENRLGLHRKVGSTTSDCAYFGINLYKRERYWHAEYPEGVLGESTRDVIDLDESNYKLESQNRKYGKVIREKRCDARGKYKKGEGSVSLLMAISGDERDGQAFSFYMCFVEGGTDLFRFYNFLSELFDWLDVNRPGRSFLLTMDNLNIHRHPAVLHLIADRGHRVVFRAPYWSCDGAIEYVFNTLQTRLQMDVHGVENVLALVGKIAGIIGDIPMFKNYFIHVGFPDN
jgi:hypothetical protein